MARSLACLAAAGLVGAALTFPVDAQETPTFGETIDVRVVNIEVVVTDREGNRVSGLKPEDFRVKVDGKQVPVEYFSEIQEGRSVAPAGAQAGAAAGVRSVAAEGPVGTYYLVFIDDYFSIAPRRNEVLKAMKTELGRLGPDDRMAVVAYDGGRLAMLSNWSNSQSDLQGAFDRAMERKARGFDRLTERRDLDRNEQFAGTATADGGILDLSVTNVGLNLRESSYGETLVRQVRDAVGAAVSAMRGFGGPPGRKVMLLLSGGWPYSVQSSIRGSDDIPPSQELPSGESLYRVLTGTANLLGYTVYPVDVPGDQTLAADAEAPAAAEFASFREQEVEGSLHFIAKETGGKPLLNSNRNLALANAAGDTRSYYWLGFSPAWKRNDKLHSVKVEVARPGLELRYRTSFRDLSRKAEVSMKVESALLFGNLPGVLPMPMRLGRPARTKKGALEIPVTLGLPADLMTVLPAGGKFAAELELRFAASDANGNSSEIPVVPLKLSSAQPPTPGGFIRYETTLTLKGKADHLVAAVYDPLSGKVATAEAEVVAPQP
jgi:VWFA-related protein